MRQKFRLVLTALCFQTAWADKPTPGATPGPAGKMPPAMTKEVPPNAREDLPNDKAKGRHAVFGAVTGKTANSFTVSAKDGPVLVTVTATTKFRFPGKRNATLADLAVRDRVAVNGTPTMGGLTAKQVAVVPGKPTTLHRVGKVTAYTAGSSITIETVQGKSETFTLTAQTVIRNPKGSGVAVGDRVTIVTRRDPSADTFTATGIVAHPE